MLKYAYKNTENVFGTSLSQKTVYGVETHRPRQGKFCRRNGQ